MLMQFAFCSTAVQRNFDPRSHAPNGQFGDISGTQSAKTTPWVFVSTGKQSCELQDVLRSPKALI